ncbi:MAG: hypothetical protein Q8Q49_02640 [bacterium]|nr:hypothetical protein [bacterium]
MVKAGERVGIRVVASADQLRFSWTPATVHTDTASDTTNDVVLSDVARPTPVVRRRLSVRPQMEDKEEPKYLSEAETKAFFGKYGTKLGDSPYETVEHNKFGVTSRDAEAVAIEKTAGALCRDAVPRSIVEQWVMDVAIESGTFSTPKEMLDWRMRGLTAFGDFAERNLKLAVSDVPTDPFVVSPSQ